MFMRKIFLPILSTLFIAGPAAAQDKVKRVVEPIPAATTDNLSVSYTHLTLPTILLV